MGNHKHYKSALATQHSPRNVKVKKKRTTSRSAKLGREMAIFVRVVVGALLCLGGISARSLSEVLRAADVESAEGIVEALTTYVSETDAKLAELAAFEARIAANEGFIARIDTLEDLRCCKDVKCQNYRGTLAVTKKG